MPQDDQGPLSLFEKPARLEQLTQAGRTFLPADYFRVGQERARCVARIIRGGEVKGTGFLLPGNWLLTNHHVLRTEAEAADPQTTAQFNYELRADGLFALSTQFHFDPAGGFKTSPDSDGDDWTIVKLRPNASGEANGQFGMILLEETIVAPGDEAHIIQHPDGRPKQVASGPVLECTGSRVLYLAETLGGSSGSPVFGKSWKVIALHHAGAFRRDANTGERTPCNEGIHINAVIEGLRAAGVWPLMSKRSDAPIAYDNGPMPPDSPWYVERKADRDALRHLRNRGVTLALKGGTQLGKSSLANRLEAAMAKEGWRTASIDVGDEFREVEFVSGHAFLKRLAEKICEQVGGSPASVEAFDRDGTPSAFRSFINRLRVEESSRLLITLDHMDALTPKPYCSAVLSGLRLVHTGQSELGPKAWVKLILILTVKPKHVGPIGSVFDVAKLLEISDFSGDELNSLIARFGSLAIDAAKLHDFLGGHPALCRLALNALVEEELTLDVLMADAKKSGGIFKQHLDGIVRGFRAAPDGKQLANAFRAFLRGEPVASEDEFEALLGLGVVRGTYSGDAALRCNLYREWLPPRLPR